MKRGWGRVREGGLVGPEGSRGATLQKSKTGMELQMCVLRLAVPGAHIACLVAQRGSNTTQKVNLNDIAVGGCRVTARHGMEHNC